MARMGYKTLLVDADLKVPTIHRRFGIDNVLGITDVVSGNWKRARCFWVDLQTAACRFFPLIAELTFSAVMI